MKVCPECLETPANEQRDGSRRDGRCRPCLRALRWFTRRMKENLYGDV